MIVFFTAMMLCGCSVETVFDGGAPVAVIALLVAIACAVVLGSKGGERMIKTTTKRKRGKDVMAFKIEGDLSTIVSEVCHTLARGVEVLAEDIGDTQVESTLYATIRMAIMHLEKDGHIIDRNRLGHALMEDNDASTD